MLVKCSIGYKVVDQNGKIHIDGVLEGETRTILEAKLRNLRELIPYEFSILLLRYLVTHEDYNFAELDKCIQKL